MTNASTSIISGYKLSIPIFHSIFAGQNEDFMEFLRTLTDSLRPHMSMKTWEWEEFFDGFDDESAAISWVGALKFGKKQGYTLYCVT